MTTGTPAQSGPTNGTRAVIDLDAAPDLVGAATKPQRVAAPADPSSFYRRAFHAFAALTVVGATLELASFRHWKGEQWIAWPFVAALALAALLALRPRPVMVRAARVIAALVALGGVWGTIEHIKSNYDAGPLNYHYTDRWPTMSMTAKLWAAVSKSVGAAPSLVPLVLAQGAAFLLLALHRQAHGSEQ